MNSNAIWMGGVLAAVTAAAQAQWSEDPSQNLAVADRSGEQTQVKIHPTADGGAYVSWFDNSTGGYDVYLQRLDAGGQRAVGAQRRAHRRPVVQLHPGLRP